MITAANRALSVHTEHATKKEHDKSQRQFRLSGLYRGELECREGKKKKKMRPSFIAHAGIETYTTRPRVESLAYESCVRLCVRTQMRHTHAIDNAVRGREIEPLDRSRRAKKKKPQYRAQILLRDSKNRPGYFATNLFFCPTFSEQK